MDCLEMIIDNNNNHNHIPLFSMLQQQHQQHQQQDNYWPYIKEKYCTTPLSMTVTEVPQECTRSINGHYNLRWYKDLRAMRSVYLNIEEATHRYEVTTVFEGSEKSNICKSVTSLVMYLLEQLRVL